MTPQALFFDFDGVLADSVSVKTRAFARLFEAHGPDVVARVVEHHLRHGGMNRFDKFRHYYAQFLGLPLSEADMAGLCDRFAALVVEEVVAAPEIPGAGAFLEHCRGIPRFVVSGTPDAEIREICRRRRLDGHFREILGAPTDKATHVTRLLDRYGFEPAACLFFGDAGSDWRAAGTCGVPFVGILPGPDAPLLTQAPDIVWYPDFTAYPWPENLRPSGDTPL
ncbi:HAD family hydrolase [Solidesulfovibrio sp.]|uniref:HAD family hydrolase n=1 Tax=Solidesulfovibrio sp. TaxID=2910990 RepID=UPI002B202800|nr:HAD family hydrolase [Solidesulfovibrio sp.]MEA5090926.1 HAD hydrolase-like protein [Solidesulfovibrio sp.]